MFNLQLFPMALVASTSIVLAQPPPVSASAGPQAQTAPPSAPPARSPRAEPPSPAGFTTFIASSAPEARPFRVGYFGMPLVVGAYTPGQKELHVIRGSVLSVFEPEGLGFRLAKTRNLPTPPKDPAYVYPEDHAPVPTGSQGVWTPEKVFENDRNEHADVGYQIDEGGELYWVASHALFRQGEAGWKVVWSFPKEIAARRGHIRLQAGLVVLPDNRVALFGGKDAFIQVLQLGDEPTADPKVLSSISYETLGCTPTSYPHDAGPQFCVAAGNLYFYLNDTGRLFRLKLDGYSLTDYDVPWISEEFGPSILPRKWRNAPSGGAANPILPESLAFTPSPDGTVHVAALMYNMPVAVINTFDLGSEGSSVKSETKVGTELPEPLTMRDAKGDLVPFPSPKNLEKESTKPARAATDTTVRR